MNFIVHYLHVYIYIYIWDVILPIDSYFSRWLLHHQPDRDLETNKYGDFIGFKPTWMRETPWFLKRKMIHKMVCFPHPMLVYRVVPTISSDFLWVNGELPSKIDMWLPDINLIVSQSFSSGKTNRHPEHVQRLIVGIWNQTCQKLIETVYWFIFNKNNTIKIFSGLPFPDSPFRPFPRPKAKERPKPRNDYLDCYTGPKVKWEDPATPRWWVNFNHHGLWMFMLCKYRYCLFQLV